MTTVFRCIKMLLGQFTPQLGQPLDSCTCLQLELGDQNLKFSIITLLRLACLDLGLVHGSVVQNKQCSCNWFLISIHSMHTHFGTCMPEGKCRCDDLYLPKLKETTPTCVQEPRKEDLWLGTHAVAGLASNTVMMVVAHEQYYNYIYYSILPCNVYNI